MFPPAHRSAFGRMSRQRIARPLAVERDCWIGGSVRRSCLSALSLRKRLSSRLRGSRPPRGGAGARSVSVPGPDEPEPPPVPVWEEDLRAIERGEALVVGRAARAAMQDSVTWHGAYGHLAFEGRGVVHHPFRVREPKVKGNASPRSRSLSIHRTGIVPFLERTPSGDTPLSHIIIQLDEILNIVCDICVRGGRVPAGYRRSRARSVGAGCALRNRAGRFNLKPVGSRDPPFLESGPAAAGATP